MSLLCLAGAGLRAVRIEMCFDTQGEPDATHSTHPVVISGYTAGSDAVGPRERTQRLSEVILSLHH